MRVAGQPSLSYTYDNADRLTGMSQGPSSVAFTYDSANRRASVTLPNEIVMEYGYDATSQLTGITYKVGTNTLGNLTYTYDLTGSRTAMGGTWARTNLPAALGPATYDAANQIVQFGGVTFSYDVNGNLTSDGVRSYTWDARNELSALAGPVSGSFGYDGFGRRRTKAIGGVTTAFLYDGLNPVQDLSGGSPSANLLTGLGIDEYLTRTDATGARSFLTDALGSTLALADSGGTIQTEYTYEPFGAFTTSGTGTSSSFAFTRREADGTGLLYYRARYYSGSTQRFISEDPIGFAGHDLNLHAYVGNSPTRFSDPTGTSRIPFLPPLPCREKKNPITKALCTPAIPFVPDLLPPGMPFPIPHLPVPEPGPSGGPGAPPVWPGNDPSQAPPGTEWRGKPGSTPGSPQGNYYNPTTGESFHPDLNHPAPIGPHWDYRAPDGSWYRIYPDGTVEPKR